MKRKIKKKKISSSSPKVHSTSPHRETSEYCKTTLYVSGDDLDPQEVTQLLGLDPDDSHRPGDRSFKVKPDGTPDPNMPTRYVFKRGGWRRAIDDDKRRSWDVSAQLEYWCAFVSERAEAVRALQSRGNQVSIDCYINEGPVVYVDLVPSLMHKLGALNIKVSFGIYDGTSIEFQRGNTQLGLSGALSKFAQRGGES